MIQSWDELSNSHVVEYHHFTDHINLNLLVMVHVRDEVAHIQPSYSRLVEYEVGEGGGIPRPYGLFLFIQIVCIHTFNHKVYMKS